VFLKPEALVHRGAQIIFAFKMLRNTVTHYI